MSKQEIGFEWDGDGTLVCVVVDAGRITRGGGPVCRELFEHFATRVLLELIEHERRKGA